MSATDDRRSPKEPIPSRVGEGHWAAAREGRLAIQHCGACGQWVHYPSYLCDNCLSTDLAWEDVSGLGTVESFSTVYRGFAPEFAADLPYTVALVRIDEGPALLTWLVDVEPDAAEIGMRVEVVFERISDEISLHRFRPVTADA
jgi:uncharacterized OB-fold protein